MEEEEDRSSGGGGGWKGVMRRELAYGDKQHLIYKSYRFQCPCKPLLGDWNTTALLWEKYSDTEAGQKEENKYPIYVVQKQLITWVLKNTWEMFYSEFSQTQVMIPCPRATICNYCEQEYVSGDKLYSGGTDKQQEDFGFLGSFFKKKSFNYI